MGSLDGKVAVVTGGAHGIGAAAVRALVREGARVHIIDLREGDWFVGDVGDPETLERFAGQVIRELCMMGRQSPRRVRRSRGSWSHDTANYPLEDWEITSKNGLQPYRNPH
jgi:NAD(P)-dependent dehydrogenase (short-subunit alcohol dehydrogenase family)